MADKRRLTHFAEQIMNSFVGVRERILPQTVQHREKRLCMQLGGIGVCRGACPRAEALLFHLSADLDCLQYYAISNTHSERLSPPSNCVRKLRPPEFEHEVL